jgi:hypothetical protein
MPKKDIVRVRPLEIKYPIPQLEGVWHREGFIAVKIPDLLYEALQDIIVHSFQEGDNGFFVLSFTHSTDKSEGTLVLPNESLVYMLVYDIKDNEEKIEQK